VKRIFVIVILISPFSFAQSSNEKKKVPDSNVAPSVVSSELAGRGPKAIFLLKKARIDSAIGEPVIYPFERQTRNLFYDLPTGVLTND
jgi:hypothetical protein